MAKQYDEGGRGVFTPLTVLSVHFSDTMIRQNYVRETRVNNLPNEIGL